MQPPPYPVRGELTATLFTEQLNVQSNRVLTADLYLANHMFVVGLLDYFVNPFISVVQKLEGKQHVVGGGVFTDFGMNLKKNVFQNMTALNLREKVLRL